MKGSQFDVWANTPDLFTENSPISGGRPYRAIFTFSRVRWSILSQDCHLSQQEEIVIKEWQQVVPEKRHGGISDYPIVTRGPPGNQEMFPRWDSLY